MAHGATERKSDAKHPSNPTQTRKVQPMTRQDNPDERRSASTYPSPHPFQQTLDRLERALEVAGLTIFARIDHAAAAREIGMTMRPAVVLIYGNPRGGTPVMIAAPDAALDLPLHVLVREDEDGRVIIAFHPIARLLRDAGAPDALASRLQPAQALLINAVQP